MAGNSTYIAKKTLDHRYGNTPFNPPSTYWMQPFIILPNDDGTGGTPTTSIPRLPVANNTTNFPGATLNGNIAEKVCAIALEFDEATVNEGVVVGVASYDSQTDGNLQDIFTGIAVQIDAGNILRIKANTLKLTQD